MAIALLANTLATGTALAAVILAFGAVSGAHLNPVVTVAAAMERELPWRDVPGYVVAQMFGAIAGTFVAHGMFAMPLYSLSTQVRQGTAVVFSEFVASFGLLAVIWGCTRSRPTMTPFGVASYIMAAYWFTASTSFANPAVTIARALTNTFSGIRPADAPAFIAAQIAGALAATLVFRWMLPSRVMSEIR
jgi:glycerol uptake facilitator-like aquaporin